MEERFLVVIDQIEVSPVLEEALYDGGLGWFVESGRVKSRVTVLRVRILVWKNVERRTLHYL